MTSNFRPLFHFSPPRGWLNDPNGLVYSRDVWHLFYQHEPNQLQHGPMHWGHAISRDLAHWEHLPIALSPDELGTIWSGSVAVDPKSEASQLVACFTQAQTERGQIQSLAFSRDEGATWQPFEGNPVLTSERPDFRDPKIFRQGERWIMVVSGGHEAHFYASTDLIQWMRLSTFPAPQPDWIWECPDLIEVDGGWVLLVSFIVPGAPVTQGCFTHYWLGEFDGQHFVPQNGPHLLSFGPDDYAAVSWSDAPDKRKIILGWMSQWGYAANTPTASENWRGAMTLPRELFLENGALKQRPPRELRALRGEAMAFDEANFSIEGDVFELEAEIDITGLRGDRVGFGVRVGAGQVTTILFFPSRGELVLDRTQSGQSDFHPEFAATFRAPLDVQNGVLKLHLFVDRCSVEVFAQGGALYGAALIFPAQTSRGIEFIGEGATIRRGAFYPYS